VVSSFARQIAEIEHGSRPPRIRVGNLASSRDFLDIEDVIAAYLALLSPNVPCDVYNVARGDGVVIRAVLDELLAMTGLRVSVEVDPARFRPTDTLSGDATRLRRATGWRPRREWRDTLVAVLDDWRERVRAA
jgi:GDP-4-dehydro-6-deoxy-D-mannose reductase